MKQETLSIEVFFTLEQLFKEDNKKLKVTKRVNGIESTKIFQIDIKVGWKEETKITFYWQSDIYQGFDAEDIVFVIHEKSHTIFKREGNNLIYKETITLKEAFYELNIEETKH